jgi:hypothetical protein
MRPSIRFLALAVFGWAGARAMMVGALPGAEIFSIKPSEAKPPPITATQFPPIEPIAPAGYDAYLDADAAAQWPQAWPGALRPVPMPVYYAASSAPAPRPAAPTAVLPQPSPLFYGPIPELDDWPLSRIASAAMPQRRSNVILPAQSAPAPLARQALDRLQLSAWALLRGQQGMAVGPGSLAPNGMLGGSQAGARLTYNVTRQIAASFRTSSDVGRRGGEVAGGVRVQPVGGIPLWFTAERRQRVGSTSNGRNAFALFAESGLYQRPMPWDFELDAYLQAGVVGFRTRDPFIDGAMAFSRPVYRQFSAGVGVWGAAQPGLYRVDAGPRVTMKVRNNVRVHFDYRQRLAGNALPGSGPAITLAGDF